MPAKKAAKKAAATHADSKHHEGKDLRRSYEHLGRVEALQALQPANSKDIHLLVSFAENEMSKGQRKDAAELLRAAEHFSFAVLVDKDPKRNGASPELVDIVTAEVEHLTRKANQHWDEHEEGEHHSALAALFCSSLETAAAALEAGLYRQALEFARAAEALAHVTKHGPIELGRQKPVPKLPKP